MPSLQIRYDRRSVAAQFDRFEREYPARVISRVLGPWGDLRLCGRPRKPAVFQKPDGEPSAEHGQDGHPAAGPRGSFQ